MSFIKFNSEKRTETKSKPQTYVQLNERFVQHILFQIYTCSTRIISNMLIIHTHGERFVIFGGLFVVNNPLGCFSVRSIKQVLGLLFCNSVFFVSQTSSTLRSCAAALIDGLPITQVSQHRDGPPLVVISVHPKQHLFVSKCTTQLIDGL